MPGLWHDSGNELFKDDPEFARRLFRLAGVELPLDVQFIQAPTNETDRTLSNDLDPDTVLVAGSVKRPKRVIIVELQQACGPRQAQTVASLRGVEVAPLRVPRPALIAACRPTQSRS